MHKRAGLSITVDLLCLFLPLTLYAYTTLLTHLLFQSYNRLSLQEEVKDVNSCPNPSSNRSNSFDSVTSVLEARCMWWALIGAGSSHDLCKRDLFIHNEFGFIQKPHYCVGKTSFQASKVINLLLVSCKQYFWNVTILLGGSNVEEITGHKVLCPLVSPKKVTHLLLFLSFWWNSSGCFVPEAVGAMNYAQSCSSWSCNTSKNIDNQLLCYPWPVLWAFHRSHDIKRKTNRHIAGSLFWTGGPVCAKPSYIKSGWI